MKKHYLILALLITVLAVLGVRPARCDFTKENFDRIEKGMTLNQVEAVFGKPPASQTDLPLMPNGGIVPVNILLTWQSEDGALALIYFSHADGKVYHTDWCESNEGVCEILVRWFRWPGW